MRLIDADALIERLQEYADNDWNKSLGGIFIDCIDTCIDYVENAPTAYDISKVVAELEKLMVKTTSKMVESKDVPEWFYEVKTGEYINKKDAINIVKGGVE